MNTQTSVLLLIALAVPAYADDIAMDDQSQILTGAGEPASSRYFQQPQESELPDNAYGKLVQEGRAIFVDTKNRAPEYVGNGLACANCHLEQGRKANSAPLWAAYTMYPAYRKKNNKVNSYAERLQGCFQFSMNGKAPEADGPVIAALTAYSYWLATGAPTGQELPGRAYPEVPKPKAAMTWPKASRSMRPSAPYVMGRTEKGRSPVAIMCFHRSGGRTRSTGVPACIG